MPQRFNNSEKIAILRITEHPRNASHRQLAETTGMPRTTVTRILQDRDKIEAEWNSHKGEQGNSHKKEQAKTQKSKRLLISGSLG